MKQRAPRNRTLSVSPEEYSVLKKRLVRHIDSATDLRDKTVCANLMDIIDGLPEGIADLMIIDPPYNLSKDFGTIKFKAMSTSDYLVYLRSWLPKLLRSLKPDGSLYICGDWRSTAALQQVLDENMHVMNRITWQREKGRGSSRNWKNSMEDIWFAVKDKRHYYFDAEAVKVRRQVLAPYRQDGIPKDWEETADGNFRMTYSSNFMDDISVPFWSMPENTDHPTQKPEKLIAKLILASCPEGGLVLDPFLGSGTTSVVARKLNRRFLGIEINEEYCAWAEKRLAMAMEDNSIQGYSNGIFHSRNTPMKKCKKHDTMI